MNDRLLTLTALFERSVARRGDALAVKDATDSCSYRELDARADALAGELRHKGVRNGDAVVVYADRTVHTVVAVLAVLKAGAAFVPVSLDTPAERLKLILSDAGASLLLADAPGRARLAGHDVGVPLLWSAEATPPLSDSRAHSIAPGDLAYIIYTSGTSGQPKGIMIEHGGIARRYYDWEAAFDLEQSAVRVLQVAKLGFDVFIGDLVKALCSGGVLVLCPGDAVLDPARLYALLVGEAIDYLDTVPAVLRHLIEHLEATGQDLACLRTLNCGADLWTKDEYARALRITRVQRLFNGYGVTECTVENTLFQDDGSGLGRASTLPIGSALPSDTILILDDGLSPVPAGTNGQICIGGPCVARGYVNRPELDARAFFERDGVRFYKTGDLGRADANGVIEFLGRIDFQIKINGYRIELEEIERVLEQFPTVRQGVVCFDSARSALTAFVRTVDGGALRTSECGAHMAAKLPGYMVPARFIVIDAFPLNQNGKVDRVALTRELAAGRRGHDLHGSRSLAELQAKLDGRGLDLLSLAYDFVKPSAQFALLVTGALPNGTATEASPLELRVLVDDLSALKKRKRDVAGCPVQYDNPYDARSLRASLTMDGLDIALDFAVDGDVPPAAWTVHGEAFIEHWMGVAQ